MCQCVRCCHLVILNIQITVGGCAEKTVLLHNGKVTMNASIDRKGFARGELVSVSVTVDNQTNATVIPRLSLHQIQIFMCNNRHKTVDTIISGIDPISGQAIGPSSKMDQLIDVEIPELDEALSIKSSLITVKYFVNVVLDIPQAFNLQLDLPIVLTKQAVIGL